MFINLCLSNSKNRNFTHINLGSILSDTTLRFYQIKKERHALRVAPFLDCYKSILWLILVFVFPFTVALIFIFAVTMFIFNFNRRISRVLWICLPRNDDAEIVLFLCYSLFELSPVGWHILSAFREEGTIIAIHLGLQNIACQRCI